ncbi:SUF system NifU family Fe-S cluster assembly protein [Tumebacillus sp. ITR2]|uniref:SUF system NifU family Fe-S cluster assembly protein n=1 Tax=Tumebacillus amylolyticus TaxID=2801339 RepID=A0ABS1J956_9BACL|nr:SUF system NifU family Fe-S cluster assembly protein [Tumebacillus amylolyticus]MBL0386745.1 SUF system NifU family Fe-S cluster assembly protein [Tumebacillus amylolyticus]
MTPNLSDLYRQVILDHSQHPRNFGTLDGALTVALRNPTCGDEVTLFLDVQDGVIHRASFQGHGCSISMASASMLTESVIGLPLSEALHLNTEFRNLLQGHTSDPHLLGDLEVLVGVAQFPARIKCALLSWNALEQAIGGTTP